MQSGISASEDLRRAFTSLLSPASSTSSSSRPRGLLVHISESPEALVPGREVPSRGSFSSDLDHELLPLLESNVAAYVLLRTDDDKGDKGDNDIDGGSAPRCVAVTYVPDSAPVRSKMLFASTRLTLVRELGGEHFASSLFATSKQELSAEGWRKHEEHGGLSAPLTEEEQNLAGIKEAEAQESRGTGARRGHAPGVALPLGNGVEERLRAVGKGGGLVSLAIDVPTETLVLAPSQASSSSSSSSGGGGGSIGAGDVPKHISPDEPRYTVYAHRTGAGEVSTLFIYTCPTNSKIKERMLYASARAVVAESVSAACGAERAKTMEATDPSDLSEQDILAEVEPQAASAKAGPGSESGGRGGFARPKRPGKR